MKLLQRLALSGRLATLLWVAAVFLGINTLVRLGLTVFDGDLGLLASWRMLPILGVGTLYDLAALAYVLVPFALLFLACGDGRLGRRVHAALAAVLLVLTLIALLFSAVSEFLFWNEFSSRFNFIAVDYLIYTREVIGNIRESYPIGWILGGIAGVALALFLAVRRPFLRAAGADASPWPRRLGVTSLLLSLPVLSFLSVGDAPRERLAATSASARELGGNGYYEFMRAYRHNDLDFATFYRTLSAEASQSQWHAEALESTSTARFTGGAVDPVEREIQTHGAFKPLHVVLVSMESLGADYVESMGGKPGLTPNLDRLARQGLSFTQLYATGLRTVRGLEALTLSVPPTPGHAVPMRSNNKGFQTFGGVLKDKGYEALYLYGGYSAFDNMRDFFSGNGYRVVDRTDIDAQHISHETIWGVADEDLFDHALTEIDRRAASGAKLFVHIMTTSNHRPFTYPDGRIDIASGSGRNGAVKYADWAIGRFVDQAALRPWFKDTVFVFVADHTSHGRGRVDLPPENYRIPLIVYAPGRIAPRRVDTLASQIDVAPTVLALLNTSYTSHFFGQDILGEGPKHQRAFMANYLTVGYMEHGLVAELGPKRRARVLDAKTGQALKTDDPRATELIDEAISHYQLAAESIHRTGVAHSGTPAGIRPIAAAARPGHTLTPAPN